MIEWLLKRLGIERFDIGPEDNGKEVHLDLSDIYLTRWTLLGKRFSSHWGKLFLHCFRRSDRDTYHDHPWPFTSVILKGGYWEHTIAKDGSDHRRWYSPGRILRRPAKWRHWVEIPTGQWCWTLVWAGVKERSWGFWPTPTTYIPWRDFLGISNA